MMKQQISMMLATVALTSAFATPLAIAQQSQPSASSNSEVQVRKDCPALQMVVVNGTFESSKDADSNQDVGFFAQLTTPVLAAAGDETGDRSAGFTVTPTQEEPTAPQNTLWSTPTPDKDLWGSETPVTPSPKQENSSERTVGRTFVSYPASAGGIFMPGQQSLDDSESYATSMLQGVENTRGVLRDIAGKCPNTKVFLAGYSQGAQVVSEVAREIGANNSVIAPESVAGVALFSDPLRAENAPTVASGANKPAPVPGTEGKAVRQLGDFSSPDSAELDGGGIGVNQSGIQDFGAVADRTVSWCEPGDLVCDLPISGPLAQLVIAVAQQLDITDPQQSLVAVADALGPAVEMSGVDDVTNVDFGEGGFQLAKDKGLATDSVIGEVIANTGGVSATSPRAKPTPVRQDTPLSTPLTSESSAPRTVNVTPQPVAFELPLGALADMGQALLGAVNAMGGLGLGAEIAAPLEAVLAGDLGKLITAGLPAAMPAIESAVHSLSEVVPALLRNETATGAAGKVLENVEVLGLSGTGLAQTAAEAAGHGAAHGSYLQAGATADGRTSMDATVQWAVAAAADVSGRQDIAKLVGDPSALQALQQATPQDSGVQNAPGDFAGLAADVVEGVSKVVDFDPAAAEQALAFINDVVKP